jgi:hypothetical protein
LRYPRNDSFETTRVFGRLGQQPFPKRCDLWYGRSHLRADDPVRIGHSQRNIDRPYETTVDYIPGRKRGAGKRNALAVDGSIYQHARMVQNRTANNGIGDAGRFKPSRPGLPIIETQ